MLSPVSEEELSELYAWVDSVPLSRPKKSIARDFSDAVCVAEIVHHYFPRIVELHNYSPASNSTQKMYNWTTLNTRVFKKLGFALSKEDMEGAVFARPGEIEPILKLLRTKLAQYQAKHGQERAAHIPLLASTAPAAASREGDMVSYGAGGRGSSGVNKVLDYPNNESSLHLSNENDVENYQEPAGYIQSFPGGALGGGVTAAEVEDLRALNHVLEVKTAKLEQLIRLKDAKIAALTARLQGAGLLSPPPPSAAAARVAL